MEEKTENPQISVVIITLNRCEMVQEAIRSVKEQTYQPYEIIVVSDGSTDETATAIAQNFPDVIVIEQTNQGEGIARNTGIARAKGEWIALLDDDDLWHRNKLKRVVEYLKQFPTCRAVHHWMWYFSVSEDAPREILSIHRDFVARNIEECHETVKETENITPEPSHIYRSLGDLQRLLYRDNASVMSSAVVHRETLIRAGCFPPTCTSGVDWIMTLNVARLCEWHVIPLRLGFYRFHGRQMSSSSADQIAIGLMVTLGFWMQGLPLTKRLTNKQVVRELSEYGPTYRLAAQGSFWYCLRRGDFSNARLTRKLSRVLLPRSRDYLYVLIPPQITWRWERYVLGKHK